MPACVGLPITSKVVPGPTPRCKPHHALALPVSGAAALVVLVVVLALAAVDTHADVVIATAIKIPNNNGLLPPTHEVFQAPTSDSLLFA